MNTGPDNETGPTVPPPGQPTGRVLPGFAHETQPRRPGCPEEGARIVAGRLMLGGEAITRDPVGPRLWDLPLSPGAMAEAQGMVWLDHLATLGGIGARQTAQASTYGWIDHDEAGTWAEGSPARDPAVTGRRVQAWVQHATMLTQHRRKEDQRRFTAALERQIRHLAETSRNMPAGLAKAEALAGLICGAVALNTTRFLAAEAGERLAALAPELIDATGGCPERSPEALLLRFELLLWSADALSLAGFASDPEQLAALGRAAPVLRALRHGDGHLARFHGGTGGAPGRLDRALMDCGLRDGSLARRPMGFTRLDGGRSVVVADTGTPPDTPRACAGTLGFDMTSGSRLLIAAPGDGVRFGPVWAQAMRATAAASAPGLERMAMARVGPDGRLVQRPSRVWCEAEALSLVAGHNGYADSHGILIERHLWLAPDGTRLEGHDIFLREGMMIPDPALPVESRLHLGPQTQARIADGVVELRLGPPADTPDDLADKITPEFWRFAVEGGVELSLEPSAWCGACAESVRPAWQIVLRAPFGEGGVQFDWTLEKARATPSA